MAYEHKLQAKLDYFAKMKHDAAMCLVEMGAKLENEHVEPDSKAGMISLVAYVKRHKPTIEEELTADMAWKRWNEACIHHGKYLAVMEVEKAQTILAPRALAPAEAILASFKANGASAASDTPAASDGAKKG